MWWLVMLGCSGPGLNPDAESIMIVHHTASGPVDMTMDAAGKAALAACLRTSTAATLSERSKQVLEDGSYDVTFIDGTHARVIEVATSTHLDDGARTWANECALPLVRGATPVPSRTPPVVPEVPAEIPAPPPEPPRDG